MDEDSDADLADEFDTTGLAAELDAIPEVREALRTDKKLLHNDEEFHLYVKPSVKAVKKNKHKIRAWLVRQRNVKGRKAVNIDKAWEVLDKLLRDNNASPSRADLHTQSWDIKNFCTYIRSLWARSRERPIGENALYMLHSMF